MSFLNKIMGVVKLAAPIAANVVLPGAGSVVSGLMDEVLGAKGHAVSGMTAEAKAKVIAENPELLKELETKAMELEATIAQERTKNMETVGTTQIAELKHGNWWQKGWRPWNGYLYPLAVFSVYVVVPFAKAFMGQKFPFLLMIEIDVPESLWMIWGGILGVAVYGRNQEKKPQGKTAGVVKGIVSKLMK